MSNLDGYRENLREAQQAYEIADAIKVEFRARDMIKWGRTRQGYEGWLCEGAKADEAYSNWQKARSDVEHWGGLIAGELKTAAAALPSIRTSEPMTPEQVEARKADLNAQFAAKFPDADRRLPPERDDDLEVSA